MVDFRDRYDPAQGPFTERFPNLRTMVAAAYLKYEVDGFEVVRHIGKGVMVKNIYLLAVLIHGLTLAFQRRMAMKRRSRRESGR